MALQYTTMRESELTITTHAATLEAVEKERAEQGDIIRVGRCRLTVSRPVLKALMVSAFETRKSYSAFNVCFQFSFAFNFNLRRYIQELISAAAELKQSREWFEAGAYTRPLFSST